MLVARETVAKTRRQNGKSCLPPLIYCGATFRLKQATFITDEVDFDPKRPTTDEKVIQFGDQHQTGLLSR